MSRVKESIKEHEGTVKEDGRHKPYDDGDDEISDVIGKEGDIKGDCTIAYGRNLTQRGLSEEEADFLLMNDIRRFHSELKNEFDFFDGLSVARQDVLIEMAYNMGMNSLLEFDKMIEALRHSDYKKASKEMIDSDWGTTHPNRSTDLSYRMRKGEYG